MKRSLQILPILLIFILAIGVNNSYSQSRPDSLKYILQGDHITTTLANVADGLDKPSDLAFHPDYSKNELWITNQRTENTGGSTLTLNETNTPNQTEWLRSDGNAWHFMSLPTGIDFSTENLNFATSTGVFSANHNGTDFTGPTLWSSDPDVYARPSGGNGSHLDMLHGSPFCMGIAHQINNVFWVNDTYWGSLVRYDFGHDHGPGNDDHSDGKVWRYEQMSTSRLLDIPAHLVVEKNDDLLYAVDNGNNRILVMDLTTGEFDRVLPLKNEQLAQHYAMKNANIQEVLVGRFDQPCGIEVFDNYLLVGEYRTGEIFVFDRMNGMEELGVIQTEEGQGLAGIVIGPDGNIYYCNRIKNIVGVISPGDVSVSSQDIVQDQIAVYPNPAFSQLNVRLLNDSEGEISIYNTTGQLIQSYDVEDGSIDVDIEFLASGIYHVFLDSGSSRSVARFSKM
jgi:hypothetical protein